MSTLRAYLPHKREARARLVDQVRSAATVEHVTVTARVEAADATGVRRIHIRDHTVLSDSAPSYAGFDLGPTSPELQLGVLGSCLAHTVLIHAAATGVDLDAVIVEVSADLDPRGGIDGFEDVAPQPHNLRYVVHIDSPAPESDIRALIAHVDNVCPVLNLLRTPTHIHGELHLAATGGPS